MNGDQALLGIVQNGRFNALTPASAAGRPIKLTRIAMQEAMSPESREIGLAEYEGKAIMVRGHASGDWVYSAEIIDQAGPILTAVVEKAFKRRTR